MFFVKRNVRSFRAVRTEDEAILQVTTSHNHTEVYSFVGGMATTRPSKRDESSDFFSNFRLPGTAFLVLGVIGYNFFKRSAPKQDLGGFTDPAGRLGGNKQQKFTPYPRDDGPIGGERLKRGGPFAEGGAMSSARGGSGAENEALLRLRQAQAARARQQHEDNTFCSPVDSPMD